MNTRAQPRAASAAQGQNGYGEDEINYDDPLPGDEDGLQGDGGEGGGDPEDAARFADEGGEGDEEEIEFEEPVQRPGRAQNRIQATANENARLRREIEEMRERVNRLAPQQPTQPAVPRGFALQETDEQFNARIQLLPPDERMEQRAIRSEQKAELRAALVEFKNAQVQDKVAWDASCATSERRKRWSDEVERERERVLRETGNPVNREIIYYWLLGKFMDSPQGKKRQQRRTESAQERVRSQETRPVSPRSDVDRNQRGRLTDREQRARRLDGVQI